MDSAGNSGDTKRNQKSKKSGGTSGSNTNKYTKTTNRHFQSTSDAEINSLITVGEDYLRASNRVSENQKFGPDGSPITPQHKPKNLVDRFGNHVLQSRNEELKIDPLLSEIEK